MQSAYVTEGWEDAGGEPVTQAGFQNHSTMQGEGGWVYGSCRGPALYLLMFSVLSLKLFVEACHLWHIVKGLLQLLRSVIQRCFAEILLVSLAPAVRPLAASITATLLLPSQCHRCQPVTIMLSASCLVLRRVSAKPGPSPRHWHFRVLDELCAQIGFLELLQLGCGAILLPQILAVKQILAVSDAASDGGIGLKVLLLQSEVQVQW